MKKYVQKIILKNKRTILKVFKRKKNIKYLGQILKKDYSNKCFRDRMIWKYNDLNILKCVKNDEIFINGKRNNYNIFNLEKSYGIIKTKYNSLNIIQKVSNLNIIQKKNDQKLFYDKDSKINNYKSFNKRYNKFNDNKLIITRIINKYTINKQYDIYNYTINKNKSFFINNEKKNNKNNICQTDISLINTKEQFESEINEYLITNNIENQKKFNYKPKGLINFASNCYLNSLLQCFYYIKDFRNFFLNEVFNDICTMSLALKDIMYNLNVIDGNNSYKALKIKNEINDEEIFEDGKPADVTDLLDYIFDKIMEESIVENSSDKSIIYETDVNDKIKMFEDCYKDVDFKIIINKLFVGFYEREFKCSQGHIYYAFQNEYKITFPLEQINNSIKNKNNNYMNIYDCFDYYERKQNDDQMQDCNICGNKCVLTEKIFRTPNILILILDRGKNKKFKKQIDFYEYIDLKKYIDDKKYEFPTKYRLIGVSTHLGNTGQYGHYISFCLCDDNKYYCFNDSSVNKIDNKVKHKFYEGSPYILFYQRLDKYRAIIGKIKEYIEKLIKKINDKKKDLFFSLANNNNNNNEIIFEEKNKEIVFKFNFSEFSRKSRKLIFKFIFKNNKLIDNILYNIHTKYYWNKNLNAYKNIENIEKYINNAFAM